MRGARAPTASSSCSARSAAASEHERGGGVERGGGGAPWPRIAVVFARGGGEAAEEERLECECLLVATGRKPEAWSGLGLEAAGVAFDAAGGVRVDDTLRTTNPNIYAVGDVCTPFQFTHVAGAMAGIVVENALFGGARRFSSLLVPWCTYTAPEVAHVGLYERDVAERGLRCDTFTTALAHNDRAILEGATDGFVKVHVRRGTDEILGATVVAEHAGEMISELTLAIQNKIGLRAVGRTIHPYPTVAEAIQGCGVAYNRTVWKKMARGADGRGGAARASGGGEGGARARAVAALVASAVLGAGAAVAVTLAVVRRSARR